METFLAKIYLENNETLVLEACENRTINNILQLSTDSKPYVQVYGADNVAISLEAKFLLIDILHKAPNDYKKLSTLNITEVSNNEILFTWKGSNKEKININDLSKVNIGVEYGYCNENLLNLMQEKSNTFLKNYRFSNDHIDKVFMALKKKNEKLKSLSEREM